MSLLLRYVGCTCYKIDTCYVAVVFRIELEIDNKCTYLVRYIWVIINCELDFLDLECNVKLLRRTIYLYNTRATTVLLI